PRRRRGCGGRRGARAGRQRVARGAGSFGCRRVARPAASAASHPGANVETAVVRPIRCGRKRTTGRGWHATCSEVRGEEAMASRTWHGWAIAAAALTFACASKPPPPSEISDAEEAIAQARARDARKHAPAELHKAEDKLAQARSTATEHHDEKEN